MATMTMTGTSTTTINTMRNASNRWKDSSQMLREPACTDCTLKAPRRRPSLYRESSSSENDLDDDDDDDDSLTLTTSPVADSISTIDSDGFNESLKVCNFFERASRSELRPRRTIDGLSLSGHKSDSFLFVSQPLLPENKHLRRHIRFAPSVEERQYAVTHGDNPSCSGPCALTLDWEHSGSRRISYNDVLLRNRRAVRQLSAGERRQRLLQASAMSRDEMHMLDLQFVSERVESLQKELSGLTLDSKRLTKWPKAM
ncbi:hypothetical protein MPSEU_001046000 [Mayamaea pseudoterrestris]|nr:hypothetical protein MPSEU_001046000 [Mayamaea pseudoterrestris]